VANEAILAKIKHIARSHVPGSRVILFGSRAVGQPDEQSDYDILVIAPGALDKARQRQLRNRIHKAIIGQLLVPADILVQSEEAIAIKSRLPGHVVKRALQEGIEL